MFSILTPRIAIAGVLCTIYYTSTHKEPVPVQLRDFQVHCEDVTLLAAALVTTIIHTTDTQPSSFLSLTARYTIDMLCTIYLLHIINTQMILNHVQLELRSSQVHFENDLKSSCSTRHNNYLHNRYSSTSGCLKF